MEKEIKEEPIHISLWLKTNKLSLNVKDTHYMVFTKSRIINEMSIKIGNESNDEIEKTKFLGVIIAEWAIDLFLAELCVQDMK